MQDEEKNSAIISHFSAAKSFFSVQWNSGECGLLSAGKVNLVVKQSNLVPGKNYLVAGKIVAKQFILVLDSVYLVVQ